MDPLIPHPTQSAAEPRPTLSGADQRPAQSSENPRPAVSDEDPRPAEPIEPDLNECCSNGCDPCVFDTYAEARRSWQEAVRQWDARHPPAPPAQ